MIISSIPTTQKAEKAIRQAIQAQCAKEMRASRTDYAEEITNCFMLTKFSEVILDKFEVPLNNEYLNNWISDEVFQWYDRSTFKQYFNNN